MSVVSRRRFLLHGGVLAAATAAGCSTGNGQGDVAVAGSTGNRRRRSNANGDEWADIRAEFDLAGDVIHMSALLISSHPRPVREAIERHRRELDRNPVTYLESNNRRQRTAVQQAAGEYLDVAGSDIILTDSTTMGLGLIYNGLRLRPGQELVTTEGDYYVTHESLRLASERSGASVRQIALAQDVARASVDEIVGNIRAAIRPETRVLALTWVHSGTGLKLPLRQIAEVVAESDRVRGPDDRIVLCVDAVHGFGVEDFSLRDSRIDFFMAGCHKWLFGPRGTGIVWGNGDSWHATQATIPSFIDDESWRAWINESEPVGPTTATRMMPGGFKAFEHQWAMADAFEWHRRIGKRRVAERTHELAQRLKDGLAAIDGVSIITPMSTELSAGIVCFDARGWSADHLVRRLRQEQVIASVTPYATRYARLTPSIRNSPEEVDRVVRAVAAIV